MEKKLQNQVAIVTGASSGIGSGVAKSLAMAGATVVVNYPVDTTKAAAESVLDEILAAGGKGVTAKADVSKETDVQKMFSEVISQFGTVDILVNNAGLQKDCAISGYVPGTMELRARRKPDWPISLFKGSDT